MKIQSLLETKLQKELDPLFLEVVNESPQHQVPDGSESHFRVLVISKKFEGLPMIKRHQKVYEILSKELKESIHAFSQQTLTPEEWKSRGGSAPKSPPCAKKT